MKKLHLIFFSVHFLLALCLCRFASAVEEYKDEDEEARAYNVTRTTKTVDGLHFSVVEDRPIAKIAGGYRPIDIDSYVALKFNKLQKKTEELAAVMQLKIDDLNQKLDVLAKRVEELIASQEASSKAVLHQTETTSPAATAQ